MTLELILGVIRALGAAIGGYFISAGTIDAQASDQIIGGIVLLVTAAWSIYSKLYPGQGFAKAIVVQAAEAKPAEVKAIAAKAQAKEDLKRQ